MAKKVKDKRVPSLILLHKHATKLNLSLVEYILLNYVRNGSDTIPSFKGLGFSVSLITSQLKNMVKKGLLLKSNDQYQISDEAEKFFKTSIVLPWGDDEEFYNIWDLWNQYRKEVFNTVYTPISETTALHNLVKWSGGDVEIAIEGLKWTMSKEWRGFDYGIKSYLKEKKDEREQSISGRRGQESASSRADIFEEINKRHST